MSYNNNFRQQSPSQQEHSNIPSGSKLAQYLHGSSSNGITDDSNDYFSYLPLAQMTISGPTPAENQDFLGPAVYSTNGVPPYYSNVGVVHGDGPTEGACDDVFASYTYQGTSLSEWKERLTRSHPQSAFFVDPNLKADLICRQLTLQGDGHIEGFHPNSVGQYHNLAPMGAARLSGGTTPSPNGSFTYRAVKETDNLTYCLKRIPTSRPLTQKQLLACENWKRLTHTNVARLNEIFDTRAFEDNSLVFVYDHHPLATSLKDLHFGRGMSIPLNQTAAPPLTGLPENTIWSYIIQLSSAIRHIHSCGLAVRNLDLSKILIYAKTRVLISSSGVVDVLQGDRGKNIVTQQVDDLRSFGHVLVMLIVGRLNATSQENMPNSMRYIGRSCSPDLRNAVWVLCGAKNIVGQRVTSINELMPMIGARFYGQIESLEARTDLLEDELSKELESGRLFRLLCKLNAVCMPDLSQTDAMWNETSDHYLLRLFRNYLFSQFTEDGKPWLDMSHIVTSLNKFDAGVDEHIQLVSRDGDNILIVAYSELRKCLENTFNSFLSIQLPTLGIAAEPNAQSPMPNAEAGSTVTNLPNNSLS